MKKALISFVFATLVAGPVMAADQAAPINKAPMAAGYNWAGWYVGLNAGYAWGESDLTTSTVFSPTGYFATTSVPSIAASGLATVKPRGFTGGGQIGYNIQSGNYVAGIEAAFVSFQQKASRSSGPVLYPCCAPTNYTIDQNVETEWLFTFGPRMGVAFNNWLFFSSIGLAVTEVKTGFTFTDTFATASASGSKSDTRLGFTTGGGVEVGMSRNWTLRAEYQWVHFGGNSFTSANLTAFAPPIAFPTNVFAHSANLDSHIVRGAINYRF